MNTEDRFSKALNSLNNIQRAKAPEDTFAKIQQRLADQRMEKAPGSRLSKWTWMKVAATVILLISANVWAVSNYLSSKKRASVETAAYSQIVTNFNLYGDE